MEHYFCGFKLNTQNKELSFKNNRVDLTKRTYDLLSFLVENPQVLHSKDDLISQVWHNRVVSGNTIDQTVLTLKKKLAEHSQTTFIESVYGQGITWTIAPKPRPSIKIQSPWFKYAIILPLFAIIAFSILLHKPVSHSTLNTPDAIIQLPESFDTHNIQATGEYLQQIINFSNQALIINNLKRPKFLSSEAFISNQKKLNPELTLIKISSAEKTTEKSQKMAWLIEISRAHQILAQEVVQAKSQHELLTKSSQLLTKNLPFGSLTKTSLFPEDETIISLYIRGLYRLNREQFTEAAALFKLALQEQPDFHLARLKLAQIHHILGRNTDAIHQLNVLLELNPLTNLQLSAKSLKARIWRIDGQTREALAIYQDLHAQPKVGSAAIWQDLNYEYASLLQNMNKPIAALRVFDSIIDTTQPKEFNYILGKTYAAKASLLQQQGATTQAQETAELALRVFQLNEDKVGTARSLTLLARIANQQANYKAAEFRLEQALETLEDVQYPLGKGAILNELVYTQMVQAKHESAWRFNNQVLQIATEIDYHAMQMSALRAFFDMSRVQYRWQQAAQYLTSYSNSAIQKNDKRRQIKAQLMQLDWSLDQGINKGIQAAIDSVQSHIDKAGEHLMQSTLDIKKARFQWLQGNKELAIETLKNIKKKADNIQDNESIISANNFLASFYLELEQPQMALNALEHSERFNPFAVPYLRLKAEAYFKLNQKLKAYETILECQQQANDLWRETEQLVLNKIKKAL